MNIPDIEKKILTNRVSVGQTFSSFNALCKHIDIEPKKSGSQRAAIEKQLRRFFDYEKVSGSYSIRITAEHYSSPAPYITKRTGKHATDLNLAIRHLIIFSPELLKNNYTKENIKRCLGIVHRRVMKMDPRRNTQYRYESKIYYALNSALTQFNKVGPLNYEEYYMAQNGKGKWIRISPAEYTTYCSISETVKIDFHINSVMEAKYRGKESDFWDELNEKCMKRLGFDHVAGIIHFTALPGFDAEVKAKEYIDSLPLPAAEKAKILSSADVVKEAKKYALNDFWEAVTDSFSRVAVKDSIGCYSFAEYKKDLEKIRKSPLISFKP